MAGYNETTGRLLELLMDGKATVAELSKELGCSYANVETVLLKFLRTGRVTRSWKSEGHVIIRENPRVTRPARSYTYAITQRGKERLDAIRAAHRTHEFARRKV